MLERTKTIAHTFSIVRTIGQFGNELTYEEDVLDRSTGRVTRQITRIYLSERLLLEREPCPSCGTQVRREGYEIDDG